MCWTIFFKNSLFQTKSDFVQIFSLYNYLPDLCRYLFFLDFFPKDSRFEKRLLFFNLGLMLLWSRVQQNDPDEKSVWDHYNQSWESNRGQQWLSRTDQINIYQGFIWGRNFDCFSREKIRPFGHTADGAGSLLKKRKYGLFDRPQRVIRKSNGFKKLT